ncbi:unnamed protein product [Lactuca saligna]|uniref:Uncharacterized protein n=1 Tax=Lactuca saligna TaxID=75948 RepID=A0AA36EF03_LACSI|nr:unnamed protein product [Lactuca saligna]
MAITPLPQLITVRCSKNTSINSLGEINTTNRRLGLQLTVRVEVDCNMASQPSTGKKTVREVDFGGFTYKEFLLWLTKLTEIDCDNVYYFIYNLRSVLDVYIDHQNEPILEWPDNEVLEDDISDDNEYDLDKEYDKDLEISDTTKYEHVCDEEVYTFNKTIGDKFLNKLPGDINDDDDANNGKGIEAGFPIDEENQE